MNKKILAIIAVVAVVGIGAVLLTRKDTPAANTQATQQSNETKETSSEETTNGNLFTMVDAGRSHKCTYSYNGSAGESKGTMYVDGKGRGRMQMQVNSDENNKGEMNILLLADKVYSWTTTDQGTAGFVYDKAQFTQNQPSAQSPGSTSNTADPNQKFDLKCSDWSVDESMLTVPSNINFVSLPTISQ